MGLGGIVSSYFGKKGASKANAALQEGYRQAREQYNKGYTDIQNMYEPYLTPATQGYTNYVNTINGDTSAFSASPWGQSFNDYVMNNTINKLQGTAAAQGSLNSGNTLKELQTNIQSILTNDYLNRLGTYLGYNQNLGQIGLNITNTMGAYRDQLANNLAGTYTGAAQANAANQMAKYKALGNMWGTAVDEVEQGAMAALAMSDRRLKENIKPVGKLDNGLTVYVFNYKGDKTPQIGLIAQEVQKVKPEAVAEGDDGFLRVNYALAVKE